MTVKWKKSDVIKAFEEALAGQNTEQKTGLPNRAEQIKEIVARNRGNGQKEVPPAYKEERW